MQNAITTSTNWNSMQLFEHYATGGNLLQDPPTKSEFTQTIRTYNIGSNPTRFPEESRDKHKR